MTVGARALGWHGARGPAGATSAVAALGLLISPLVHDSPWTGAVPRLCYLALTVWLLLVCRAVTGAGRTGTHHPD